MRRLKIGIADGVEDDIGALAAGEFAHARGDVGRGSVDHLDLDIGVTFIGLVRRTTPITRAPCQLAICTAA